MVLSGKVVVDTYASILGGELSYAEADRWAWQMTEQQEIDQVSYQFLDDEVLIWELIIYLVGIDMPGMLDKNQPLIKDRYSGILEAKRPHCLRCTVRRLVQ